MKHYFASINNKKLGPFSIKELQFQNINCDTLIWTKGLDDWKKASEISECEKLLINIPPPIPNNTNNTSFQLYLKRNYKYIILAVILSIIVIKYIDNYFF